MVIIYLILQLHNLLLVLLQLCRGEGDHLLQLLLKYHLATAHSQQLRLQSLNLLLHDRQDILVCFNRPADRQHYSEQKQQKVQIRVPFTTP